MFRCYCIFFVLLSCYFVPAAVRAQGENNIWAFGDSTGLDFNGGDPVLIRTGIYSSESSATVCDPDGKLLFYYGGERYTDGSGRRLLRTSVFDKTNTAMPNGTAIQGNDGTSGMQGACIIPFPDGTNRYYLFTTATLEEYEKGQAYLRYSVVDMSLRGGLGDVDPLRRDVIIDTFPGETMTFAKGPDCSIWLITNRADTLMFNAYKIGPAGLDVKPVVSGFASAPTSMEPDPSYFKFIRGYMDMSSNGQLLAFVNNYPKYQIELYDFDRATGVFSNQRSLDTYYGYALYFSPEGTKLYTCYIGGPVTQYDISLLPSIPAVKGSKVILGGSASEQMRWGPDKKIYTLQGNPQSIWRINNPEASGSACDFREYLATGRNPAHGFGLRVIRHDPIITIYSRRDTAACFPAKITIKALPGYTDYTWADGSTGAAIDINTPGYTWVRMTSGCTVHTDTVFISEKNGNRTTHATDTVFCFSETVALSAPSGYDSYLWSDGNTNASALFHNDKDTVKWVLSSAKNCDARIDTFKTRFLNFKLNIPVLESICPGDSVVLDASSAGDAAYRWQDGSAKPVFIATDTGNFTVTITKNPCTLRHNTQVEFISFPVNLGNDQWICEGEEARLQPDKTYDSYLWMDGSDQPFFKATQPGSYWLQTSKGKCITTDTVRLSVSRCNNCMAMPNAFTPNGDGRNDLFRPLIHCPVQYFEMKLFNRYGEEMLATNDPDQYWDGTFNGREQELGVYYYLVKVRFDYPGSAEELHKGDVSLIR